jgi:hypothetical protein
VKIAQQVITVHFFHIFKVVNKNSNNNNVKKENVKETCKGDVIDTHENFLNGKKTYVARRYWLSKCDLDLFHRDK